MKKTRFVRVISSVISLMMLFSTTASATEYMTMEEAKDYLQNYEQITVLPSGKTSTLRFRFYDENGLIEAAEYIVENGTVAFHAMVDEKIELALAEEATVPAPTFTTPSSGYVTIPQTDGNHEVSYEANGLAEFGKYGTTSYSLEIGYQVTVSNGQIVGINSLNFDIPWIAGWFTTWGDLTYNTYCVSPECGATANYTLTKTITIEMENGAFSADEETDDEYFALHTTFE